MKSIQLPDDVYQRAAEMAEVDHVSVDRLVAVGGPLNYYYRKAA